MTDIIEFETSRLRLRQWRDQDLKAFAKMNADAKVMDYYPSIITSEQSNELADKIQEKIKENGWGFWALELKSTNTFIGFTGLNQPSYDLPVTPCIEIGWRLAHEHWGNGYVTEAARKCLDVAFESLKFPTVYSFTSVQNKRSEAVMQRLNMVNMEQNFEHPIIPIGNPLREHVLYKITKLEWSNAHPDEQLNV